MNKIARILKHRWVDDADVDKALGTGTLARIEAQVKASESRHSGEIRVCVEASLPLSELWAGTTARARALALFGTLRVWDTENNNGVLIYLLLAERQIEVLADRGLMALVPAGEWDRITREMAAAFRSAHFEAGLSSAIQAVDQMLLAHFPLAAGAANPNELPDRPAVH